MKFKVQLLYFDGCPNVEQTRQNLRTALSRAGIDPAWEEINLQSENAPKEWRGFPSPTVLVGCKEIMTGAAAAAGSGACRFGGAPSVDQIAAALKRRSWPASLAAIPAAAVGFFPVGFCPACYPAWVGLLGALGLGAYGEKLLAPVTAVLLLVAIGGLAFQGRRSRDYRPTVVGVAGAAVMYAGQFIIGSAVLKWFGIVFLVGASFWNVLPEWKSGKHCPACAGGGH